MVDPYIHSLINTTFAVMAVENWNLSEHSGDFSGDLKNLEKFSASFQEPSPQLAFLGRMTWTYINNIDRVHETEAEYLETISKRNFMRYSYAYTLGSHTSERSYSPKYAEKIEFQRCFI